jgi:opacity protein-like surface antigen
MNIKSLLLGSAAALVAVSGARAADAVEVVAEPEPMEYVRVCDTYGAGFYYIPGTETCLRVGGYIRYDIGVGQQGLRDVVDKNDFVNNGVLDYNDTYYKRARFALQVDARSETELGTLRGYAQINFNYTTNTTADEIDFDGDGVADDQEGGGFTFASDAGSSINHAYIELRLPYR